MPKARILVIEDDDDARMMYGIMLRSWGYELLEATTGKEGIRVAQKQKPDLILLDVMMPDVDGYEVCKQLRADPQFRLIPILFLSALDAMDDRIKGYTMGGDDFITKGQIDYKELGVRIQAALNRTERIKLTPQQALQEGSTLGLFSLRGGVGVSTLALNLARQSTTEGEQPTLLLDLALPIGSIGLWSGVKGTQHLVELLSRNPSEINITMVKSFSIQNMHGFHFIPGPSDVTDLSSVRMEAAERLLHLLQAEGYYVILDMGRGTLPLLWRLPQHCDWVGVITSGDPTSRNLAGIAMESLVQHGVDPRNLLLIFNDVTGQKPADVTLGLPRAPDIFIPYTKNFQNLPEPSPISRLWSMTTVPTRTQRMT